MRKFLFTVFLVAVGCLVIAGCQNNENNGQGTPEPQEPQAENEIGVIEAVSYQSLHTDTLTLLEQFSHDLNLDGSAESIELYTAAERHESGEIIWDDGQDWLLVVRDGDKAYPLLSEYVQIGTVYFTVSEGPENELPHITSIVSTGAGLSLQTYVFDRGKNAFERETVYSSPDDNFLFNSLPTY